MSEKQGEKKDLKSDSPNKPEQSVTIQHVKDYIQRSYEDGHRLEAMILLYHFISLNVHITYARIATTIKCMIYKQPYPEGSSDIWGRPGELHFGTLVDILLRMGVYTKELYRRLKEIQEFRGRLMHRFFTGQLNTATYGKKYKLGMRLLDKTLDISQKSPQLLLDRVKFIGRADMLAKALDDSGKENQGRDIEEHV